MGCHDLLIFLRLCVLQTMIIDIRMKYDDRLKLLQVFHRRHFRKGIDTPIPRRPSELSCADEEKLHQNRLLLLYNPLCWTMMLFHVANNHTILFSHM